MKERHTTMNNALIKPVDEEDILWGNYASQGTSLDKLTRPWSYWFEIFGHIIFIAFTLYVLNDLRTGEQQIGSLVIIFIAASIVFGFSYILWHFHKRWHVESAFIPQWLSSRRVVYWDGNYQVDLQVSQILSVHPAYHAGSKALKLKLRDEDIILLTADADKLRAEIEGLIT